MSTRLRIMIMFHKYSLLPTLALGALVFAPPATCCGDVEARLVIDELVAQLEGSPDELPDVLRAYERIEDSTRFHVFERHRVHVALLRELRKMRDPILARTAEDLLGRSDSSSLPSQVLLIKAMRSDDFPLPRHARVNLLGKAAYSRSERLAIWAVRTLGDTRWDEAVDELIRILKAEEAAGRYDGLLFGVVDAELYRLLGSKASPSGAAKTEKDWEEMEKKLPREPDHSPRQGGKSVFFGDRIGPRSVFCIDISSSMRQTARIRGAKSGDGGETKPKIEVVKRELADAVGALDDSQSFNIISYDATPNVWRGGRSVRLVPARSSVVRSAVRFAEGLDAGSGTNIHDTLVLALSVPDVESIYLLSDGAPSRGGGPEEIVRRVAAMNYLLGVRIITYGIGDTSGSYDDALMKRLARENWGWYRRLD